MLLQGRVDRALKRQAEQKKKGRRIEEEELVPADIMEKGDLPAMIIAGLITIFPVALGVLLLMGLAGRLFMT